ncbi:MAG: fibronectin type III domain-containing protein [Ruminococcus sp.]
MYKKFLSIILTVVLSVGCLTFSASAKAINVSAPKLKSVTAIDTTTFKIKWSKVTGASGYILYCQKSGSSFKKIKTFGKNTTSYTHKKLANGKKYFYKVKAYTKTTGKYLYSRYSNMMGLKCNNNLVDLYKPYYMYSEVQLGNFVMGGDTYNGFYLPWWDNYIIYNLKGKYRYISFTYGLTDNTPADRESILQIYSDDSCVATFNCKSGDLPKYARVNIENAVKLEFRKTCVNSQNTNLGVGNIKLYK